MTKKEESPDDSVQINAQVLRKDRELLNAKAKAANLNASQFIQRLIYSAEVMSRPDLNADIQKMNAWLGRINSNINMLSKWANIYKGKCDAELIAYRLASIQADVREVAKYTQDLRAQGFGKRRKKKAEK